MKQRHAFSPVHVSKVFATFDVVLIVMLSGLGADARLPEGSISK